MSRKTLYFKVKDEGRDQGKTYLLTEMAASQAEMWAARAFLAMANAGLEIPQEVMDSGMGGLASLGVSLLGKLPFEEARPLMDEMFICVRFIPDESKSEFSRALVESDIEEIKTRLKIRVELLKLHSDFFQAVAPSTSASAPAA